MVKGHTSTVEKRGKEVERDKKKRENSINSRMSNRKTKKGK